MNKKFENFFNENGFKIEKNSAYGIIKGYETNAVLNVMDNTSPLLIYVSFFATDEQKKQIRLDLQNAKIKFFKFEFTDFGIVFGLNDITISKLIKRLPEIFETTYSIIKASSAKNIEYCPHCGEPFEGQNKAISNVDGLTITLDSICKHNINSVISAEEKDFKEAPNNYLRGFFGAVIGGIVGAVISIILYLIGFISSISAFVSIALGAFLYQKLGGKRNKMMIVIVSATTIVMMLTSVFLLYYLAAYGAAIEVGLSYTASQAFSKCMQDETFSRAFIGDMLLTLLFTVIGIVYEIIVLAKSVKRKQQLK